ncbi:MAG: hypothetical protein M3Z31_13385, partial [Pseudomonadota bacterium]|nr:hypothetical protein [Pseudomonadota bacterium]
MSSPRKRLLIAAVGWVCAGATMQAAAEDLMQVYREAQQNDPVLAGARATWSATQERLPQARAALL